MTHEIVHALSIGHSDVNSSIMYRFYILKRNQKIDVNTDDIAAIQYLYGRQVITTMTTTNTTPKSPHETKNEN